MRLAAPIYRDFNSAEQWAEAHVEAGHSAADTLLTPAADDATAAAYVAAARQADIVIAEVGAWSNPIDPDPRKAAEALEKCRLHLDLAERLGARCCVNIAGSRNPEQWDGPHAENLSADTFDLIVESVRSIIDAVKPRRTVYALETMPWIFPSSPDEYLALIRAVDRPAFGVHLDPVNMINSPERVCRTADFIRECFAKLGPHIRGCHAKDVRIRPELTVHIEECRPGTGVLDYGVFLRELDRLDPDMPLALEHLPADEYPVAAEHLRAVAARHGIAFRQPAAAPA